MYTLTELIDGYDSTVDDAMTITIIEYDSSNNGLGGNTITFGTLFAEVDIVGYNQADGYKASAKYLRSFEINRTGVRGAYLSPIGTAVEVQLEHNFPNPPTIELVASGVDNSFFRVNITSGVNTNVAWQAWLKLRVLAIG